MVSAVYSDNFVQSKALFYSLKYSKKPEILFNQLQDRKIQWNNFCFTLPKFQLSFINMVGLLLSIIYSCRLGRWELLLECIHEVTAYAFAYSHVNYSRYLTVMLGSKFPLEEQFPEVFY